VQGHGSPGARVRSGTYSIVAVDLDAGQMGVAVQSHWFGVGAVVPWAVAGVGVVATQANANLAYGPRGLALLGAGAAAEQVVERLVAEDPGTAGRQLAVGDRRGAVASHTGPECLAFAGAVAGEGFSCQANLMASPEVWPAMASAYERARGPLAARLLTALGAAEAAGGDVRGRQSAALVVVPVDGEPWERLVSLRVEDHAEPLVELERLYELHLAYEVAGEADWALGEGRLTEAGELYARASAMAPGNHELLFWAGLGAAQSGDLELGAERVARAIALHPGWTELLARLPESLFPQAPAIREALER
jgi:uncharacterized Ntn-hydrolase superfamily protein